MITYIFQSTEQMLDWQFWGLTWGMVDDSPIERLFEVIIITTVLQFFQLLLN